VLADWLTGAYVLCAWLPRDVARRQHIRVHSGKRYIRGSQASRSLSHSETRAESALEDSHGVELAVVVSSVSNVLFGVQTFMLIDYIVLGVPKIRSFLLDSKTGKNAHLL